MEEAKKRDEDGRKFFKRLSSVKIDYERENRRTIQSYGRRDSDATFLRNREEILALLKGTVKGDELEGVIPVHTLLFNNWASNFNNFNSSSKVLKEFLAKVFFMEPAEHEQMVKKAKSCKISGHILHLEVVEARNLPAMDVNGLSDPFCTIYVTTRESSKRTKVIPKTLAPVWKESFKFKVADSQEDFLCIEIWDFDAEERIRDKLKRCKDLTSPRAIGNFMKDLGNGRSSSQEYMGRVSVPIKTISSETTEKWWRIGDAKEDGEIYLRMGLGLDVCRSEAVRAYRVVLQLLVIHDLESASVLVPFHWERIREGGWSDYLLKQLRTCWGLSPKDILLAKWMAYIKIHSVFPLSGRMLPPLLFEVFEAANNCEFNANDITAILTSASELLTFSVIFIQKIHQYLSCPMTNSQLYYVLKTMDVLGRAVDRLGINRKFDISSKSIMAEVLKAVREAARLNVCTILEDTVNEKNDDEIPPEVKEGKRLLKIGQLINDDMEKGCDVDKDFKLIMGIDYNLITYEIYDIELAKLNKPFILQYCKFLETLASSGEQGQNQTTTAAATFIHLYLCMKKFSEIAPPAKENVTWVISASFYHWFTPGISSLLQLMGELWTGWMSKAVEADYACAEDDQANVVPYPNENQATISSSAVDSVQIFTQIQTFWATLSWPDPEQRALFAQKLLKELCGYSIFFGNLVTDNVEKIKVSEHINPRLCRSINNIKYVGDYTKEISINLNLQQLLIHIQQPANSDRDTFMDKQIQIQESGLEGIISGLMEGAMNKLHPQITSYIKNILETNSDALFHSELTNYFEWLCANLEILDKNLLPSFFIQFVVLWWQGVLENLKKAYIQAIKVNKPPESFSKIQSLLEIVKGYFETVILQHSGLKGNVGSLAHSPQYKELIKELELNSASVAQVKSKYYATRENGDGKRDGSRGFISFRALYDKQAEVLLVEILNASKLPAADSNGSSDPFVQLTLVPEENFQGLGLPLVTKVLKETLYPIFEQTFSIKVGEEALGNGSFLKLTVFDHDVFKKNRFLGEVYFPAGKIQKSVTTKSTCSLPNIVLPLTAPLKEDIETLKSLIGSRSDRDKELKRILEVEEEKVGEVQVSTPLGFGW